MVIDRSLPHSASRSISVDERLCRNQALKRWNRRQSPGTPSPRDLRPGEGDPSCRNLARRAACCCWFSPLRLASRCIAGSMCRQATMRLLSSVFVFVFIAATVGPACSQPPKKQLSDANSAMERRLQKGAHRWQRGPTDEHGDSHPWVRAAIRGRSPVRITEGPTSDPVRIADR